MRRCLNDKTPDAVVRDVDTSGLRGRGGAGFPTGTKWASIAGHPCPTRFVVCNAAEGELLTTCPGYRLSQDALDACYFGNVIDFAVAKEYRRRDVGENFRKKERSWD